MVSTTRWVADKLKDEYTCSIDEERNRIEVTRESRPPVTIGVMKLNDVELEHVMHFFEDDSSVDFVLNVPVAGRFLGEAINWLCEKGIGWGGLADAHRGLRDCDSLSAYENPERRFFGRGLRQHPKIMSITWLDDHRVQVSRQNLPDRVIYMGSMYQPTAESVREAIERYGAFDIFAATNPNSNPTAEAAEVAEVAGIRMLKWRPTLAALHR